MDKKILIAFSAVFLLFIAGCGGGETSSSTLTTPFLGGQGGVEIKFLEGNPPAEVTDTDTFPFKAVVSLKNVGEHDIGDSKMKVNLIGFLPSQFKATGTADQFLDTDLSKVLDTALTGRKKDADGNIIEPVETFLTFPTDTKDFKFSSQVQGNTIFVFRADACYLYKSKAISELCILQNQIDKAPDAVCNPTESKTIFSSGSPIKATSFRQNVAGKDKVQFSFDVMHSGTGNTFDPAILASEGTATVPTCPKDPSIRRAKEDKVLVTVDTGLVKLVVDDPVTAANEAVSGYTLNCVGLSGVTTATTAKQAGTLKLIDSKRTITCTLDLPASRTDFKKPIDITIDFSYGQTADKEVLVKHILS